MSYNGYNSYQPYYNQQRTSDASDQYGCQYTSGQGYQRTPYTTPQANVNGQQSHPPSQPSHYSTSTYGEPSRYTGVDSSGTAAYQNPRNDYGYAHGVRSPENTTALGSLAYASSLRQDRSGSGAHQDGDSLQRVADYNRATSSYAGAQRSENRSNGVSYSDYSAPNNRSERADSHYHSSSHGTPHYSQAAPQNTPYPSSLPSVGQQKSTYKPPSRPSSGQNIRQPRSLSSTTSNQSPRPSSNSRYPPPEVQQNQTRTPTPQHLQQSHRSAWAGSSVTGHGGPHPERQPSSTKSGNNPSQPAQLESRTSSSNIQSNGRSDADRSLRLPSIHGAPQDQSERAENSATTHDSINQNPTTIDPNKVFNEYEYQKRQAAIAAEAKANKEKAEAEVRRKQAEQAAASKPPTDEVAMKEQMEAEMKLMLEKMRDYKSKDPSLFSQIWEQVKKAQPPTSTRDALPASKEVSVPSPHANGGAARLPSPSTPNVTQAVLRQPDPNSQLIQELPTPVIEEDRGKFPAARRRGKKTRPSLEQPTSQVRNVSPPPGPPAGYVHAGDAPSAPVSTGAPGPPNGYIHAGDVDNNTNSFQKVWVSGKGGTRRGRPKGSTPKKAQADSRDQLDGTASMDDVGASAPQPMPVTNPPASTTGTTQTMTPKAPPRPTGQTHWPEEDKWALAISARDTLLSHPVNRGKSIESEEIRNLLDQGPSYEELCGILEGKGFVVERTPFAQQLLSAVPRLKQQRPPSAQAQGQPAPTHQPAQHGQPGQGGFVPVANMQNKFRNSHGPPQVATKRSHASASRRGLHPQPQPQTTPTSTKEQNAKKRNFSDIVNLTAAGDSDEELDRQRAEKLRKIESMKADTQTRSSPPSGAQSSAMQSDDDAANLSHFKNPVISPQRERLRKARDIITPMNRALALRRSAYNPRTIARDILVAAGKHPIMPPLNYHLEGLKTKFRHVEVTSDLSTFNWGLIDPGGPPPKQPSPDMEMQPADAELPDHKPAELSVSNRRAEVHIVANSTGGEPPTVAAATKPPKGLFSKRRSLPNPGFMASRPSFGLSPGQPQAPAGPLVSQAGDISMLGAGESLNSTSAKKHSSFKSAPTSPLNSLSSVGQPVTGSSEGSSSQTRRGRPGRPPGVKNKGPYKRRSGIPTGTSPITPEPRLSQGPLQGPSSSDSTTSFAAPMSAPNARRVPKTPARPSGLRNEVTISPSAGFAVVIPSQNHASQTSRPGSGKSSKSPLHKTTAPAPIPKRQVYRCRWQDCLAELHNLDTLRKHVRKHMDEFDEDLDYECLWADCGNSVIGATNTNEREPLHFRSATSWERHMDGRHLDQYAWDLGDGPSPHPSDAEASDYLSDSQQGKVTPEPSANSRRPDVLKVPPAHRVPRGEGHERDAAIDAYQDVHGNTSKKEKARAEFEAQLQKRRAIGAGITKGGTTFVNDKRRALLTHGPYEIRRVEDDSD